MDKAAKVHDIAMYALSQNVRINEPIEELAERYYNYCKQIDSELSKLHTNDPDRPMGVKTV